MVCFVVSLMLLILAYSLLSTVCVHFGTVWYDGASVVSDRREYMRRDRFGASIARKFVTVVKMFFTLSWSGKKKKKKGNIALFFNDE